MTQVDIILTPGTDADQTASVQSQLAAAGNGTLGNLLTINMPDGRYRIDGAMELRSRSHIRWTCLAGVFTAHTDKRAVDIGLTNRVHFRLATCTNVIGSNLAIEGPNNLYAADPRWGDYHPSAEGNHAFSITSNTTTGTWCEDCGWENCTYLNPEGDGFYVGGGNTNFAPYIISNRNIHLCNCSGSFAGRHGGTIVDCDGYEAIDCTWEWAGRAGFDCEPNGSYQKGWNVHMLRVDVSGRKEGFSITGGHSAAVGPPPNTVVKKNWWLEDCSLIVRPSLYEGFHVGSGAPAGNAGYFVLDGCTDLVSSTNVGATISGFDEVTVKNCRLSTGLAAPALPNAGVSVGLPRGGPLTITDNDLNGRPGASGFDNLYNLVGTATSFIHYGNVWAMGTQNDGGATGNYANVSQTLPKLTQASTVIVSEPSVIAGTIAQTLPALTQEVVVLTGALPDPAFIASGMSSILGEETTLLGQILLGALEQAVGGPIAQTLPALTQAIVTDLEFHSAVTQTLPAFTQNLSVGVTPHGSIVGIITQTLPALTQDFAENSAIADITITQTLPMFTQAVLIDNPAVATITQTLPALTQHAVISKEGIDEWLVSISSEWLVRT